MSGTGFIREIVLDTETTGMDPDKGDRLVEIGCIELENHIPTGRHWHKYVNPERDVPAEAVAVHGITQEFLKDKPVFSQVYTEMLEFLGDARLVIHNAQFDMKFLNAELRAVGHPGLPTKNVIDTVQMARAKFPGSPANLDALCRRFSIDNSGRDFHGALLDSQLLAEVYLELLGGRQHGLSLGAQENRAAAAETTGAQARAERVPRTARPHAPSADELALHQAMVDRLKDPLWKKSG